MIRRYRYACLAAAWLAAPSVFAAGAPADVCASHSTALLDALGQGHYAHAGANFNTEVAAALNPGKLKQVWSQIQTQVGTYEKHAAPIRQMIAGHLVVATRLSFTNMPLTALVACDADGRINTFRLVPSVPPAAPVSHAEQVEANGARERSVQVMSPLGPLSATLTLPKGSGPFPAVLLVAGSGPSDRDEAIGPNKPFLDLAHGLAAEGIASLRYDKRTLDYGTQIAGDTSFTVDKEVTDDALAALKLLAHQPHIDGKHLFVIGHSLGAMMAPRIGKRDPQLAGLVLMAAPARPLLAVSAEQVREQGHRHGRTAAQIAANEKMIGAERRLLAKADSRHPLGGSFAHLPQSYWLSLHDYQQVQMAKSLTMPILILQGGSDFQVSPTLDFARWKQVMQGHSNVSFHLYPGLSHLFMPGGSSGTVADYKVPGHVDHRVIDDIALWIKRHS